MLDKETKLEANIARRFISLLISIVGRDVAQIDNNREHVGDVLIGLLRDIRQYMKDRVEDNQPAQAYEKQR